MKTNFDFWSYYSSSAVFFPPFVWLSLFWGCYKGGGEDWNKALVWWSNIHYNTIVPQQILTSSIDSVCVLLELCCWLAAPKKGRRDRQVWRRPSFSLHERRVSTTLQGVDKCRRRRCTRFMSATPQFFFCLFKVQPKRRKKKKTFFCLFFFFFFWFVSLWFDRRCGFNRLSNGYYYYYYCHQIHKDEAE